VGTLDKEKQKSSAPRDIRHVLLPAQ